MDEATNDGAMSEDELDTLTEFLQAIDPPAMSLESVDGFFAALICSPQLVMPSEYLRRCLDGITFSRATIRPPESWTC